MQKPIDAEVRSGNFETADEFLEAAAKHFVIARDFGEVYSPEEIDAKVRRGLAQIERGETVDGDEVLNRLRGRRE